MSALSRRELIALAAATTTVGFGSLGAGCGVGSTPSKRRKVIVVGAGLAGLGAAAVLRTAGFTPIVLEARPRIGGRVHTVDHFGTKVDLGAAWIHDSRGNPLTAVARGQGLKTVATDYDRVALRKADGSAVSAAIGEEAMAARDQIISALSDQAQDTPRERVAGPLQSQINRQGLTGSAAETLQWLLGVELPLDVGADPNLLSLEGFNEGDEWNGGPDLLMVGGASQLVAAIAKGTTVRTGAEVVAVRSQGQQVAVTLRSGAIIKASGCIVTVPLGVLKASTITFDPPLPAATRRAISRISVGVLDKVFLDYSQAQWPQAAVALGTVGESLAKTVSVFPLERVTGKALGVGFIGGAYAVELERAGPAAMVEAVVERMGQGFPELATPRGTLSTAWKADRFARGSYSFLGPSATATDRVALGRRSGRVILAGEHTSINRPATMDGAWLAGRAAASRLVDALT
ncbi:MAG: FAD-dependent oxidoreductase [Solirubrobacterales bacterium]|nr:FAD-dependent oxidoreductase [Solirubrobacterales bacterium]